MAASELRRESAKMKNNVMRIILVLCLCIVVFAAFDKDKPSSSTSLRSSNPEILANWSALETSIGNEHEFSTGGANTGDHTQGSARSFSQATAPATQIDGGAFASTDLGSLWVDTDDNAFYMLTATTPTWTPVSTEVIATMLASARVFGSTLGVTGTLTASGAVIVGTTLDVTGNIDPTTYETTNGGFLDEDAMGSDAANKVVSQQSLVAYIATQLDFGAWGTTDADTDTLTQDVTYTATSDGFVVAYATFSDAAKDLAITLSGGTVYKGRATDNGEVVTVGGSVASGETFIVTENGTIATLTVKWRSRGPDSKPTK